MKNRIKELREKRGMSQADLARLLETTNVSVSRYEREPQRITLPLLEEIANALRVKPEDIIGDGPSTDGVVYLPRIGKNTTMAFDAAHAASLGQASDLQVAEVADDSMAPTVAPGDLCIVDASIEAVDRDGVYAIRSVTGSTILRRVSVNPLTGNFSITTDNPVYGGVIDAAQNQVEVIGRVVWVGKRL